jgi:TetR/AcrR family fatty acid metabolism transcriptional regulator
MNEHSFIGGAMPESEAARPLTAREVKRQRILRAAIEVFASKGYFAARMTDVAKQADVADGTLYLYFDGKEHLLLSVFDDVLDRFIRHLVAEIETMESPREKLRTMVRLHLETLSRDRALAHVLQIETRHTRHFMGLLARGKLGEYLSLLKNIIEEGQQLGCFRRDVSARLATDVVFGAVDELILSWLMADETMDLNRHQDALLTLLFDGLVPCEHHQGAHA